MKTDNYSETEDSSDEDKFAHSKLASTMLSIWTAIMSICTVVLSFYLFVLKDESVFPFVVAGMVGLCIPHMVHFIRATIRHNEIKRIHEERIQKAIQDRILQARYKESERLRQEKIMMDKYDIDERAQIDAEELLREAYRQVDRSSLKTN